MVGLLRRCHLLYTASSAERSWTSATARCRMKAWIGASSSQPPRRRSSLGAAPAFARPRRRRRRSALVTADLESSIVAVDVSTARVHGGSPRRPIHAASRASACIGALVAHTAGGRMTLIDSDLRVHPITGAFGAPRYTAVSPGPPPRLRHRLGARGDRRRWTLTSGGSSGGFGGRAGPSPRDRPRWQAALGRTRQQGQSARGALARGATPATARRDDPTTVPRRTTSASRPADGASG